MTVKQHLLPRDQSKAAWHTQPGGEPVVSMRLPDGRTIRVAGYVGRGARLAAERGMAQWLLFEHSQRPRRPYKPPTFQFLGTVADLTRTQAAPSMLPPGHPAKPFGM